LNSTEQAPALPAAAHARKPSAFARLAGRSSGTVVSLILHGGLILLAFLSVAPPRMGRGGGVVGRAEGTSEASGFVLQLQREAGVDAGPKTADLRVFPAALPETEETPEADPPPPEDILKEVSETGISLNKAPPSTESAARARSAEAYARLPASTGSEAPGAPVDALQKGSTSVNGAGGDTGGAGEGSSVALYMPAPDYPASARRRNIEGVVLVAIDVHSDGHCDNVRLAETSGCEALDDAALLAIRKWKYEARPNEGTIVRRVRFVFKLQK
jgi:TonB family protein